MEHQGEMIHKALAIGLDDDLFSGIQALLNNFRLRLVSSMTVKEASRLLIEGRFYLLIADLIYLRDIQQMNWLAEIRRISFVPVIILSETPMKDLHPMIELGADICVSSNRPDSIPVIADLAIAQVRRYTEYNHFTGPGSIEVAGFQVGDIFIDPPRRIVKVQGQPVELRPREFSLLLYFMRNPNVVLTSEQICDQAWGMNGYQHGVAHPVRLLRQAIELDPKQPTYIQTVRRAGYRFTPNYVETCDIC